MYVWDANNYIWKFDTSGNATIVGGNGTTGPFVDGVSATGTAVAGYTGLSLDQSGNLYMMDKNNSVVHVIDRAGIVNTFAGQTGSGGLSSDGTLARASYLSNTSGMVSDSFGNIYVADTSNNRIRKIDAATGQLSTVAGSGVSGFISNGTAAAVPMVPRNLAINGSDLYYWDNLNHRIFKIQGVIPTTTNAVIAASWTVVPPGVGHTNLRERLSVTPATTTTSSKMTIVLPTSFAVTSPSAVETYGLTGTVTPALSGTTLSLSFSSQTLNAGVPIAVAIEGVTNGGANGSWNAYVALNDGGGSTVIGSAVTNVVNITASGAPVQGAAGFGSIWKRSLSTAQSATSTVAVSPSGTTDATNSFTLTNSGTINANVATLSAPAMTVGAYTLSPVTADSTTSVASASFATNRFGLQFTTATGTLGSGLGSGFYSGLASAAIASGASATNVLTTTARAKVDYLQPAGTYKSTLTWRFAGGV